MKYRGGTLSLVGIFGLTNKLALLFKAGWPGRVAKLRYLGNVRLQSFMSPSTRIDYRGSGIIKFVA